MNLRGRKGKMAKILVIDDSPLFRLLLKEILSKGGYDCYEAATVTEGLALFFKEKPDLVIKDLIIGDANPLEVIKEFVKYNPEVKIVVCSTATQKSLIYQAIKAGAQDFLIKPFHTDEVTQIIHRLLAN
ncbi:MAG TPA: two-component system response regulator [Firmicutes bacterium]|nr:two-component system response regulator [Bacillota bacterium]HBR29836.1 two-component system response regulator [Bacillota bacterium]